MNIIERGECLLDAGSSGNMNFSVICCYRGTCELNLLRAALSHVQSEHILLQSTIYWDEQFCEFYRTNERIELSLYTYQQESQWKEIVDQQMSPKFTGQGNLLWRVAVALGEQQGLMVFSFHHAIADGLSAVAMINQVLETYCLLSQGNSPSKFRFSDVVPDLDSLNFKTTVSTIQEQPKRIDDELKSSYLMVELDNSTTQRIIDWNHEHKIHMNATINSAFTLALSKYEFINSKQTIATTVVNLRRFFQPSLRWEIMRLLRVCLETPVDLLVTPTIESLASYLDQQLYMQLENGDHLVALNSIATAVSDNPSPQRYWQRSVRSGGIITNIGQIPFEGDYGILNLEKIFFVANIEPIVLTHKNCAVIGALTFKNKLFLTLFYIKQQLSQEHAKEILVDVKQRLESLTVN